jgi:single-strand DNA-binding protein
MNKVILIGNLGSDVDLRYTQSGTPVANFRMATNKYFKDSEGNKKDLTEWHRIVVWKGAETHAEHLKKGSKIGLEGELRTRTWEDGDGNTHYVTEIVATSVEYLTNTKGKSNPDGASDTPPDGLPEPPLPGDGDVPF